MLFSGAVERLWASTLQHASPTQSPRGREVLDVGGEPLTVVWVNDGSRFSALLARPPFVERQWLAGLASLLDPHDLRARAVHDAASVESPPAVVRRMSDTGLPWTLVVEPEDMTAQEARLLSRQRIWMPDWCVWCSSPQGSWVVGRAVSRELTEARRSRIS